MDTDMARMRMDPSRSSPRILSLKIQFACTASLFDVVKFSPWRQTMGIIGCHRLQYHLVDHSLV